MEDLQVRYDFSTNTYSETVEQFLSKLSPDERRRQENEAFKTVVGNFKRFPGGMVAETLAEGKKITATGDAFFEMTTERLTAVIVGTLTPQDGDYPRITLRFMLPEEFDQEFGPPPPPQLNTFELERNEIFLSMDEARIREFADRYGIYMPWLSEEFWQIVHANREQIPSLPMEERLKSKAWLDERHITPRPGPYSLDEQPSLDRPYGRDSVLYVQPVYRQEPNGMLISWLELIVAGKVHQRIPIRGEFATVEEAIQVGLKAREDYLARWENQKKRIDDEGY